MAAAMALLSPDHRVVVALRFYRDMPVDDIARRLGVPSGTGHSRLHYALRPQHHPRRLRCWRPPVGRHRSEEEGVGSRLRSLSR
jgi:hypothetical protein